MQRKQCDQSGLFLIGLGDKFSYIPKLPKLLANFGFFFEKKITFQLKLLGNFKFEDLVTLITRFIAVIYSFDLL